MPALLASAGFGGQKCSAASRALIHQQVFDGLSSRLRAALETLLVGPAETFGVDVPPLIERSSCERVERMVTEAATEGAQVFRVQDVPEHGFFAAPTIVEGPAEGSPITREEIFGPVLTLEPVPSVELPASWSKPSPTRSQADSSRATPT